MAVYKKCDCHIRYKESLMRRMRNQEMYFEYLEQKLDKKHNKGEDPPHRTKTEKSGLYGYTQPFFKNK